MGNLDNGWGRADRELKIPGAHVDVCDGGADVDVSAVSAVSAVSDVSAVVASEVASEVAELHPCEDPDNIVSSDQIGGLGGWY